ncbi:MAG TPA: hypothetical protein ENN80_05835 [Candidatus Hydrogenedentes bacterium]|nr:hypothetical protein [Candidatus Hydrogenedentota bacterium]
MKRGTKEGAHVRAAFLYPPSTVFSEKPDGWWSWPGNEFDAEARQASYAARLREVEADLGMRIVVEPKPIGAEGDARAFAEDLGADTPDGLLLVMFYNNSLPHADIILAAAEALHIPAVFYIGLGVKHGGVTQYRRPGLYFIQALDDLGAIRAGMRMINTKKLLSQSRVLSISEHEPGEAVEPFLGVTVAKVPFSRYAAAFDEVQLGPESMAFIAGLKQRASEIRGVTDEAFASAARAHFALKRLLDEEQADGLTMNCLRRGMLKPCISFATLNGELVPAACENDLPALYTQLLGQLLTGRPGFQHNPCYETERNHYYASHCTCATKAYGPDGHDLPFLLRRFAHTNEGSCAIQVFWNAGDPVTMARYYPGEEPALDVYSGEVVVSHPMPPAGGCTTNVEIALADRSDACMVTGHHNLLFCGDYARRFRQFARLYRMRLADTGFEGSWPA